MPHVLDAVIIGGGISGLACARALDRGGAGIRLITKQLGGRMYHSADGTMNFGATYVTDDYHRILRFVGRRVPLRWRDTNFERGGRVARLWNWRFVRSLPCLFRLIRKLREFRRAVMAFRRDAELASQREVRKQHSLIDRYSRQPAAEFIEELGLQCLNREYASLLFRTTYFAEPEEATALAYLTTLLPVAVRMWVADFRGTYERLTAGYEEKVVLDEVIALRRRGENRWEVHTAGGTVLPARNVVLAAPYADASKLYPVPGPPQTKSATMLFVGGPRRLPYAGRTCVVFADRQDGVAAIWRQGLDWDQVYSLSCRPNLQDVYESPRILQAVSWKTAIVLAGADWAPLVLEPGVYLVGDHNLCGLEDSYVTGLCAARHILGRGAA